MITEIRDLLHEHARLPVDVASLADDADLYAAGLSSFATVHLMLALEERFDVEFSDDMLNRKSFASIAAIHDGIAGLMARREAA